MNNTLQKQLLIIFFLLISFSLFAQNKSRQQYNENEHKRKLTKIENLKTRMRQLQTTPWSHTNVHDLNRVYLLLAQTYRPIDIDSAAKYIRLRVINRHPGELCDYGYFYLASDIYTERQLLDSAEYFLWERINETVNRNRCRNYRTEALERLEAFYQKNKIEKHAPKNGNELKKSLLNFNIKQLESIQTGVNRQTDSSYIETIIRFVNAYEILPLDTALAYVNKALGLATGLQQPDLQAVCYHQLGKVYQREGRNELAEENLLKWADIRKTQSYYKYRWALAGLCRFYRDTQQKEKLAAITEKRIAVLHDSYKEMLQENPRRAPSFYKGILFFLLHDVIEVGDYQRVNKHFNTFISNTSHFEEKWWLQLDLPYFIVEEQLIADQNSKALTDWYKKWINTVKVYSKNKETVHTSIYLITKTHYKHYKEHPFFSLKYILEMQQYAQNLGNDKAIAKLYSDLSYDLGSAFFTDIIKHNLELLETEANKMKRKQLLLLFETELKSLSQVNPSVFAPKLTLLFEEFHKTTKNTSLQKWSNSLLKQMKQNNNE